MTDTNRFSNLTDMQRKETISMLTAAAENGCTGLDLSNVAERYIRNAYGVRGEPMTGLIGLCYKAEQQAGTLA